MAHVGDTDPKTWVSFVCLLKVGWILTIPRTELPRSTFYMLLANKYLKLLAFLLSSAFKYGQKISRYGWFQLVKLRAMYCFRNCSLIRSPSNVFNLAAIKDRFTSVGPYYQLSPLILLYANNLTTSCHNYTVSIFSKYRKTGQMQ